MAEESSGGERTEEATSKRREDFREKGQVAQSKEVQTAALFTFMLLFWFLYLPTFWEGATNLFSSLFRSFADFEITSNSVMQLSIFIIKECSILILPLLACSLLVGIMSSYFQVGWLFTTKPLVPDFKKLDPIQGSKKFFSKKALVDLVKSIAKIVLVGYLAYSTIFDHFGQALLLTDANAGISLLFFAKIAGVIFAKVCAALILIAFIDFLYVKWEMEEKMKMTKQEVKEEYKESEGDPRIKSQIRSIQMEMARKRMMAEVPGADVIITNPTHISVAVKYDSSKMEAPIVLAKGADIIAMKIREIARKNDVPIVENPPVARLLHKIDLGATIPEELFKAVAEILAHVYTLKGKY
ncbi:MAG: flagellar biosynthesis protein FlhB [Deltaproteobacteria bacterium]|nr:MAG: flagellar biosynthesis protein FlhB [Deltaproteobacteria bacterium]